MADLTKTVEIVFSGKNNLTTTMGKLENDFNKVGSTIEGISAPLASVTDKILKVDAALAAMVAGGMALAIKTTADFNQGFALISTSVDATGSDLAKYRENILNYSSTSVKSISDINGALYTAAQAGIKYGDSLEFMGKAEQLAVANNANLNTTVDLLTGTMNAYGYSIKDVGHLNDVFFTSTLIGKQTIDDLGQSMGQVVGIAANFGVSFESLSAAISTLTAKGMETSEAITAVKGVITTIVQPSQEAAKAAAALGLDFSASALKARGFEGIIADVMKATGGSADKMATLFGEVRALNGAMQLTGDGMEFFNKALNQIENSTGSSAAAYEKMVNTFKNQSQMLLNNAQGLLISVGTKLEPVSASIATSLSDVMKGVKISLDAGAFDPLFAELTKYGTKIADTLKAIAKNLPEAMKGIDFSVLIKSLNGLGGSLGDAFQAIFGNIDLTTVEGLHTAIQKITNGLAKLIDVTKGIIDGMKPLFSAIGKAIEGFNDMDSSSASMVGTLLGVAKSINVLADYSGLLTGALSVLAGKSLLDATSGLVKLGSSAIDALPGIKNIITNLGSLGALGAVGAAGGIGYITGSLLNQIPAVQKASQSILGLLDVNNDYFGALPGGKAKLDEVNAKFEEAVKKHKEMEASQRTLTSSTKDLSDRIGGIPEKKTTLWEFQGANEIKQAIIDIGKEVVVVGEKAGKALPEITKPREIIIGYIEDENGRKKILTTLEEQLPKEKKIEIKADMSKDMIEKIKATSDIVQKSIEWKAKVNIADIEAATKQIEAAFGSVNNTITSTGTTMSSFIDSLASIYKSGQTPSTSLQQMVEAEAKRRDDALEMQKKLVDAQVDNLKARTDAMRNGDAMIKINGDGLQPHLEAFMFEILAAIQIRANAEGAQLLVGTGA